MKYAINLNTVLPVRAENSEKAEMVTQLLFGEYCEILQENTSFVEIRNHMDGYSGWVDKKMLTNISEADYKTFTKAPLFRVCMPVADAFCLTDKSIYRLSAGSILPNYDVNTSKFGVGELVFQIHQSYVTFLSETNADGIVPVAMSLLNTPYLWGGKNAMGIDCSGLAQVVFSLNGFLLPRDASQQVSEGESVEYENAEAGDLMFFGKDGKTTHVAIYLGDSTVIHASGKVKKSKTDNKGILSDDNSVYTHYLTAIKRVKY